MSRIDRHPPGAFCWVELGTSDQPAARAFYTSLFGWQYYDSPLLEGINDISGGARQTGPNAFSADDLIAAYRQVIATAHSAGVKVIGCTLTPLGGSAAYSDRGEEIRSAANNFIRTSREFDAVVDFEAAVRHPANPKQLPQGSRFAG